MTCFISTLTKFDDVTRHRSLCIRCEVSDELTSACQTYAVWLHDSTEVTSKQLVSRPPHQSRVFQETKGVHLIGF